MVPEGRTLVCKADSKALLASSKSDFAHRIALNGVSVQEQHAVFVRRKGDVTIEPASTSAQVRLL